ncbi:MAG: histidine phosphatase family protein [Deltaproteobacteria bacterium]
MTDTANLAKIYLGRHCKVIWNLEGRLIGTTDLPLCPEGIAEAYSTIPIVEKLGLDRIVCSPLKRAYETSKIYSDKLGIPLEINTGLREIDHGLWNGQKTLELLETDTNFVKWFNDPTSVSIPSGSEPIPDAQRRIVETVKGIALKYPGEKTLVVMHKHIRSILTCSIRGLHLSRFRENISETVEPILLSDEQINRIFQINL